MVPCRSAYSTFSGSPGHSANGRRKEAKSVAVGLSKNPRIGSAFALVAFTIVVLGGMGSIIGALIGGLIIGVVESLSGLYFGESLGQIGIFLIFILVLLFRPTGLFGARA